MDRNSLSPPSHHLKMLVKEKPDGPLRYAKKVVSYGFE